MPKQDKSFHSNNHDLLRSLTQSVIAPFEIDQLINAPLAAVDLGSIQSPDGREFRFVEETPDVTLGDYDLAHSDSFHQTRPPESYESYQHLSPLTLVSDQPLQLAQAGMSTDAGGGLVQQDDDSDYGAIGWGGAGLGLLGLVAIVALAGDKTTETVEVETGTSTAGNYFAYTVDNSGGTFSVWKGGGGNKGISGIGYLVYNDPAPTTPPDFTITLPIDATNYEFPANYSAGVHGFEIIVGSFNGTSFTVDSANQLWDATNNDLLLIWDSGKWGGRDVGVVIQDVSQNGVILVQYGVSSSLSFTFA